MSVTNWMSWEGGVDVAAMTDASLPMPNVIVHVARMVHTPVGSTPAGLVLVRPDVNAAPIAFGFVCGDERVGRYFGPMIFAGTPFENAPVLRGTIDIEIGDARATSRVRIGALDLRVELSSLGESELIHRPPGAMPFAQQGVERAARAATVTIDGRPLSIVVPSVGLSGGAAAVVSPCGVYAR